MAKSRSGSGDNKQGLVIALVFFVLTTIIAGVVAYMGYAEQEKLLAEKKKAVDDKKAADTEVQKEQLRRAIVMIATGVASDDDRTKFEGLKDQQKETANDTFAKLAPFKNRLKSCQDKIRDVLSRLDEGDKAAAQALMSPVQEKLDPQLLALFKEVFSWDPTKDANNPKTVSQTILDTLDGMAIDLVNEKERRVNTEKRLAALNAEKNKQVGDAVAAQKAAETALAQAKQQNNQDKAAESKGFKDSVAKGQELGQKNADQEAKFGDRELAWDKEKRKLMTKIHDQDLKIAKLEGLVKPPDIIQVDVSKGRILTVDHRNGRANISLGSADGLKPQITFSVYPPGVDGKAAASRDRKGAVEVTDVLGPHEAQVKIIDQTDPIRDMILRDDLLFNPTWNPNLKEHVALTGMMDLNGDGLDDNEEFVRLLERQGVVVDAWLDLRDLTVKGKGITLGTSYLIVGETPNIDEKGGLIVDPRNERKKLVLEAMGKMQSDARDKGIQPISARRFLAMIGYKLPKSPQPADYGAGKYLRAIPVKSPADAKEPEKEPAAAPKKDEKEEGKKE
jgi:hypothetical protein